MARTYSDMIDLVINWSNRDPEVFGIQDIFDGDTATFRADGSVGSYDRNNSRRISDFLQYAADKCYRKLRVPSLEFNRLFDVTESDIESVTANIGIVTVNLPVPLDLIDVISIRDVNTGCVFEEKLDNRTYFQRDADKTSRAYWTRQGNIFKVSGFIGEGTALEIHYYRRLPALDASYFVRAATYNIDSNFFTYDITNSPDLTASAVDEEVTDYLWFDSSTTDFTMATAFDSAQAMGDIGRHYIGNEIEHWLRDENERIILFGALYEAFMYLQEPETAQQYGQQFMEEIEELNREEKMRMASGGNVKINFNGGGLI